MKCALLDNGISIKNDGIVRPCCNFYSNNEYNTKFHINNVHNIDNWRNSEELVSVRDQLKNDIWPYECSGCQQIESQNREDSLRIFSNHAYNHYNKDDISLEFRPGNTCNFACQTCWPEASSKVLKIYKENGFYIKQHVETSKEWNFNLLDTIKDRLKDIIILGGEPFYDIRCKEFISWVNKNSINSKILIFTNGSMIDCDFLENNKKNVTLIFSIDAVGKSAEYIRFGTNWEKVEKNYRYARSLDDLKIRVNITTSPYNYIYINELIEWLLPVWPDDISFGPANIVENEKTQILNESLIPLEHRELIVDKILTLVPKILKSNLPEVQKRNTIVPLRSIIKNLKSFKFDVDNHYNFINFINTMDKSKNASITDYCPELVEILSINNGKL